MVINLYFLIIIFFRYLVAERLAIKKIIISVRLTLTSARETANGSLFQMLTGALFIICVKSK